MPLESICRLCNQLRALPGPGDRRHPIQKTAHQDTILKVIGIDVSADHAACPPYVCLVCHVRLKKALKIKRKQMGGTVTWNVPSFQPDPVPDESSSCQPSTSSDEGKDSFARLNQTAKWFAQKYGLTEVGNENTIVIVKLEPVTTRSIFRLVISCDFSWELECFGDKVPKENQLTDSLSERMDSATLDQVMLIMINASHCTGHSDLSKVIEQCRDTGKLVSHDKTTTVAVYSHGSVRSPSCSIVMSKATPNSLCEACGQSDFRNNLRARESYLRKEKSPSEKFSKFTPHAHLTETQKSQKLKNMGQAVHKLTKKVKLLQLKVSKMLEEESVEVDSTQHQLLNKICKENKNLIAEQFPDGSAQSLLWQQQLKRQKLAGPTGMRWHPTVVRWCISMFIKSPAAYRQLANSGFLHLPSQTTLKSYINFTQSIPDINIDVLKIIVKEFNLPNPNKFQTNVCLVWDEMKIKSGLVVGKGSGKVIGFCSLDDFSEELQKLSELEKPCSKDPELATHILVFMVRGVLCKVNLPFLWYPCTGFTADQLWGVVWKATRVLEDLGLQVRAWTCDGATPNRKFFRVHEPMGLQYQDITYGTQNRFASNRVIYFICDVPHLLKTTRNNLENSHGHQNSKSLVKDGKSISWSHIVSTVQEDLARGLVRLPKIREEHIHLSPQLRMRVGLAAQILSQKMGHALQARQHPEFEKTAEFCFTFDKWFDCLNGRQRYGPKPNLNAYDNVNDPRLLWLTEGFLGWLNGWEREVQALALSKPDKNRCLLSYQTSQGLKITTNSFVQLAQELLREPGVEYLVPEKLNQDRLEIFFSKMRRGCGDSDNPTVEEARHRILALIVAGRSVMAPRSANSVVNEDEETQVFMPRRKRSRK